jgi:ribosome maturation factor RimP
MLEQQLKEIVERRLPDESYFLTEIVAKQAGPKTKISIFLDGDRGIDIDVCAQVSRQVGKDLEDMELMKHPYTLMVSSPGLDRPLKLPRQYRRNLGKTVKIKLLDQQFIEGVLSEVKDNSVVVENKNTKKKPSTEENIPFAEIETTHVLVTF